MLTKEMFEKFIGYGECTEKRNLPPKGGAFGNKKKRCRELVDITAKEIKGEGI
ncbi:hypothetical protein [uncultured Gemmiger sp.]|uniref:hypothetical protein n=1 Tax=uncultured Gemmiger sp. TaxID=1623490 RepID=UPI0025F9FC94|nr:hypothetical protein [uncultured Gemmiger sp.]